MVVSPYGYVVNIHGTSDNEHKPGFISHIDYWQKMTGQAAPAGYVGAHVQIADAHGNQGGVWYIAAVSRADNMRTEPYLHSGLLVPVNP